MMECSIEPCGDERMVGFVLCRSCMEDRLRSPERSETRWRDFRTLMLPAQISIWDWR